MMSRRPLLPEDIPSETSAEDDDRWANEGGAVPRDNESSPGDEPVSPGEVDPTHERGTAR